MTGWIGKRRKVALGAAVAAVVALAAVYGIVAVPRNAGDPACKSAVATAKRLAPLVHGDVAAINVADEGRKLPELAFQDGTGATKTLADWRGKVVLLNLWATWCVPCRKEMPALDALQKRLGGPGFEVVAVNIDTRFPDKPKAWLQETGVTNLAYYNDQSAKVFQNLKQVGRALGMPTTLLVNGDGCEIAYLAGPAQWDGEDAGKLVEAALKP